ncbi:hypothetical protein LR48_Vigan04g181300 [Vigna angularis]|uniref:Uncharacterized protein n=1 Tax=Phaseolus angularis TaxID=3914 RepID=A0A0L9UFE2_PHAAN|nr:hypothetical protein LR48_Vigan04g181300 [Vigna angularis]
MLDIRILGQPSQALVITFFICLISFSQQLRNVSIPLGGLMIDITDPASANSLGTFSMTSLMKKANCE